MTTTVKELPMLHSSTIDIKYVTDSEFTEHFTRFSALANQINTLLIQSDKDIFDNRDARYSIDCKGSTLLESSTILTDLVSGMTSRLLAGCSIYRAAYKLTDKQKTRLMDLVADY